MSEISFNCPWCEQHLEAPAEMAGDVIACPSCEKEIKVPLPAEPKPRPKTQRSHPVKRSNPRPHFPIIIRSSTRALYAKYIWNAFGLSILLILGIVFAFAEDDGKKIFGWIMLAILALMLPIALIRLWLSYRRIKNTEYRIFPNKIEVSSYLFRFLGAYNNVVNLSQLRQIQGSANTMLDLWFFKCGSVTLTVSGDVADFELTNIYQPSVVRKQIEEVAFGKENVYQGSDLIPEIDDGD